MSLGGIVLRAFAAQDAAKKAKKAQEENERRWQEYENKIVDFYRQSRGSSGSALLPLYFGEGDASLETQLGGDFRKIYDATSALDASPYEIDSAVSRFEPAFEAGSKAVDDLFSGQLTNERLATAEPVLQARRELAQSKKASGLEALQSTLNEINAIQKRKGFVGDSFNNRLLNFGARRSIMSNAANDIGAANLANATDVRSIRDAGLQLKLNNLDLPLAQAQRFGALKSLPGALSSQSYLSRIQPLQFFRIGNTPPNLPSPLMKQPIPGKTQIWTSAGAQASDELEQKAMTAAAMYFGGGFGGIGGTGGGGGGISGSAASGAPAIDYNQDYVSRVYGLA